jgi:hypothetical protein
MNRPKYTNPLKDKRRTKTSAPSPIKAPEDIYWSLPRALWWILTRNMDALHSIAAESWVELASRYCAERVAISKGPASKIAFLSTLSGDRLHHIDQVTDVMRPRYTAVRMQGGETLVPEYRELEKCLPSEVWWALPWSEWRLKGEWDAFMRQFERAKSELVIRMHDGSITVIGRPNGVGDPRPIERYWWAYYGLFAPNGELCGAPSNLSNEVLLSRTRAKSAEATIWFDLLVEAKEVCGVWPKNAAASDAIAPIEQNRRPIDAATEHRARDAHATIQRIVKNNKWHTPGSRPSKTKMARELAVHPSVEALGLEYEALRKIVAGRYPIFQSLGLEPVLIGTGTKRRKKGQTNTRKTPDISKK